MADRYEAGLTLKLKDQVSKELKQLTDWSLPQLARSFAGVFAGMASFAGVSAWLHSASKEAADAELRVVKLGQALNNAGLSANLFLPQMQQLAKDLSRVSRVTDEQVLSALDSLVSFGHLGGAALERAAKAALDFSEGSGRDLGEVAMMIAKAANGSTKEWSRLGLEFSKTATDAEKLNTVLGYIEQTQGGKALEASKTFAGQTADTAKEMREFAEAIGGLVNQGMQKGGLVDFLHTAARGLRDLAEGTPAAKAFLSETVGLFGQTAGMGGMSGSLGVRVPGMPGVPSDANRRSLMASVGYGDIISQIEREVQLRAKALKDAADEARKLAEAEELLRRKRAEAGAELVGFAAPSIFGEDTGGYARRMYDQWAWDQRALSAGATAPDQSQEMAAYFNQLPRSRAAAQRSASGSYKPGIDFDTEEMQSAWDDLASAGKQAAAEVGGELVHQLLRGELSARNFGKLLQNILEQLAVQTTVKLITSALMSQGGIVPAYAASGLFVPRGSDRIPAMLTPGEMVIPAGPTRDILGGRVSLVGGGGRGGGGVVVNINTADAEGFARLFRRYPDVLADAMDRLAQRGYARG